ncbi:hypothetical protein ACT8ZR_09360 [Neobacillus sp. M.A.Huq-85]
MMVDNFSTEATGYIANYNNSFVSSTFKYASNNTPTSNISTSVLLEESKKIMNVKKLLTIGKLNEGWNHNGANPFSKNLIKSCENLICDIIVQPELFPTGRDSIQIEYEKPDGEYLELEIFEDKVNMLMIDSDDNEKEEEFPLNITKINEVVLSFYG